VLATLSRETATTAGREEIGSRPSHAPVLLLCQGGARFQCVEDGAGEESFEAADRFAFAFAFGLFAFEVSAGGGVVAGLRDRDSVERGVQLPVAAAVESVPLALA